MTTTRDKMMKIPTSIGLFVMGALVSLHTPSALAAFPDEDAAAQVEEEDEVTTQIPIRVVQQRPIIKSGRFELSLGAGLALNDRMYDHWFATATGRMHVSEWISIGATYAKYFASDADLQSRIIEDFELVPELSSYDWYAGADVSIVALDGKFIAFDSALAYWDLFVSIGGGVTVTSRSEDVKPTGMIGVGMRFFMTEWLTMTFELKDHIFPEDFGSRTAIVNNVTGSLGLTIFFPFGFDYQYAK